MRMGKYLTSREMLRYQPKGAYHYVKAQFMERSRLGRVALLREYKNRFPLLYRLVKDMWPNITSADFYELPPIFVAGDKVLENDKPRCLEVYRRTHCIKRCLGLPCDKH